MAVYSGGKTDKWWRWMVVAHLSVHEFHDEQSRGVVVRYLHEWGATVVQFQEMMLESGETQNWNLVRRGFLEGFLAVNEIGHSGELVVARNKTLFSKKVAWIWQCKVAVRLKKSDAFKWVVTLVYGSVLASLRDYLWEELTRVVSVFQGPPLLLLGFF